MAQNDKGGADLDIFEGLGKKAAPSRTSSGTQRSVPPPPPSMRNESKRTLVGMTAPQTLPGGSPSAGGFPPPPSSPSRMPPPPPGRGSLPPVGPGAVKTPPAAPAPLAQAKSNVDVDWDDDDEATQVFAEEATHIFAEDETKVLDEDKTRALPGGGAPTPAPMPAAGMPAPMASRPKATLLGLTAPAVVPPPNSRPNRPLSTPPPPPPGGAFGRSSGFPGPSSYPPPPTINPSAPPPAPLPAPKSLGAMPPWGSSAPASSPRSAPDYAAPPPRAMEATQMLQPRLGLTPSRVAIALAGVAVLVLLAFVLMPNKGKIIVNVSDSHGGTVNKLDVYVDGEKTPCATAPCYLPYGAGSHEVKVVAEGFDVPAAQAVVVKSGDSSTVSFALGSSAGSGIKVGGAQAGVKLFVDDKEVGPLPQVVRDLAPGDHTIRVAGSERYQPLERHVTVERDKIEDLGTITLKVLKGKVTVSLGTGGARVFIVSGSDRRELPMLPISVDIDTAKSWSLEGTKAGFDDYRQLISFDDGTAEKTYTVTLEPKSAVAPTQAAPQYNPAPQYTPPPQAPAPAPRPAPAPVSDNGGGGGGGGGEAFLNINSIPPSTCILDGKSLGSTPRVHVSVKPGSHTVKFVDSDDGLTKTITVNVGAGETKPAVARLQ